jgi:hypothetical protein
MRYDSVAEVVFRLLSFSLHNEFSSHQRLAIHLQYEQMLQFSADEDPAAVAESANGTTLTTWFSKDREDPSAQSHPYPNF